jgi:transcription initiation factor TFIIE subunit alpha
MLAKFLKEVVIILVGKQAEPIADLLESKKHVNEFLIAKKLGLTINQTRNILYKIADYGLVSSVRKKDKRKGWYTYFWKLENLKALEFLKDLLVKKIENANNQIKSRETKVFYSCPECHVEYNEENSLLHDFTCPECGQVFAKSDNTKVLKDLKKDEEKLRKELAIIDDEINKEKNVVEKKRVKEKNKFEKERKEKRKKALSKSKKEKEKLNKKFSKNRKTKKTKNKPKKKIKSKKRKK